MHQLIYMTHMFALAAGLGASICGTVFTMAAGRMDAGDGTQLMQHAGPLFSKIGATGLALLIVTGAAMTIMAPGMVAAGGIWFHIKMVFVIAAIAIVGFVHIQQAKLRRGGDADIIRPRLRLAVRGTLVAATGAMICAVLAFH